MSSKCLLFKLIFLMILTWGGWGYEQVTSTLLCSICKDETIWHADLCPSTWHPELFCPFAEFQQNAYDREILSREGCGTEFEGIGSQDPSGPG